MFRCRPYGACVFVPFLIDPVPFKGLLHPAFQFSRCSERSQHNRAQESGVEGAVGLLHAHAVDLSAGECPSQ